MAKRITVTSLLLGILSLALLLGVGCGPSTELTGIPIPNTLPDTRVTARPPDVLEAGFVVQFYWTGNDADGRIDHYQWKISNNGTDGISVQDTMTFDPVTGDTLNPWFNITASDSTFLVTADIPDFPNDPVGFNRSFQTHTFWVRAVDEDGGVDPSPAMVSFTSTTLLPTVTMIAPAAVVGQLEAAQLPSTVTFLFEGTDPDFSTGLPTQMRYLWKKALLPDGTYADTRNDFTRLDDDGEMSNLEYLVSFEDSLWSPWLEYDANDETRRIVLENQPQTEPDPFNPGQQRNIFYAFAIQTRDTAGAVSITRGYGNQVANVRITQGLSPNLRVVEQYLGEFSGAGINLQTNLDIAAGQELNFSWTADASDYAGEIVSYRYGWDVTDVTDPNDPNWALLPGNSVQHRRSPPRSFASGVHTLTIQVEDNSQQVTRRVITLNVVPVPDPSSQLPLLLVDDVFDHDSNQWIGPNNNPRDRDEFRDEFWEANVLDRVAGFDAAAHVVDTEVEQIEYRDVVQYRSLVWIAKWVSFPNNGVARLFRPTNTPGGDLDRYVWLQPYQESVGNVLYASSRGLNAFLAESPYELPVVFQSREGRQGGFDQVNGVDVRRGFGERELPDGTTVQVGLLRYPYFTMGVATLDIMSPNAAYYEYGIGLLASQRRSKSCASMKGLAIDPDFKARYMPQGGVFPDTIWSDSQLIDWKDTWGPWYTDEDYAGDPAHPGYTDPLAVPYTWQNDEFYDADVVGRNTNYDLQICEDGERCVESMFRSISRYDWVQQNQIADGNEDWPAGFYGGQGQEVLDQVCGSNALSLDRSRAITNDQVVGFIARKTAPNKPSQVGDVVFGFDPYRFDHTEIEKVVHWVLGEHFGLSMNP